MAGNQQSTNETLIELVNGRIVDVERGIYFAPGTRLVLRGSKIEAILAPGEPFAPAQQIDLGGRALLPGLFNTHSHIQLTYPSMLFTLFDFIRLRKLGPRQVEKSMADCLTHGVLHVRDAISGNTRPNRKLRAQIAAGELPGPRIYQCVHISPLGGAFARKQTLSDRLLACASGDELLPYDHPASGVLAIAPDASERQVREAVERAIDQHGADCIKLYDQKEVVLTYKPGALMLSEAQMAAAVDQTHRRGLKATLHHCTVESFRRGVRAGVDSFAHLPLDGKITPADAQAFQRAGCILEPTVTLIYYLAFAMRGASETYNTRLARLNEYRSATYPGLVEQFWLPAFHKPALGHFKKAAAGKLKLFGVKDMSGAFRFWARMLEPGVDNLRLVYAAGGLLACGSDAGAASASEAMVNLELVMLAQCLNEPDRPACFTPADALRAASLHSARSLGVEAHYGTLAPGKTADLVVLDGDPLADLGRIGAATAAVFVDGQLKHNPAGLKLQAA